MNHFLYMHFKIIVAHKYLHAKQKTITRNSKNRGKQEMSKSYSYSIHQVQGQSQLENMTKNIGVNSPQAEFIYHQQWKIIPSGVYFFHGQKLNPQQVSLSPAAVIHP